MSATLDRIKQSVSILGRSVRAIAPFVPEESAAVNHAHYLIVEVQEYAQAIQRIRDAEDSGVLGPHVARELRTAADNRLLAACTPARL